MSLPENLVGQSSLTSKQLASLMSYLRVQRGELKLREAADQAAGRQHRGVTLGSYYRTVTQAKENVRESVVTLLIGAWLGAIKVEDLRRLLDLVAQGARDLSEEDQERFVQVLRVLLDRIVV